MALLDRGQATRTGGVTGGTGAAALSLRRFDATIPTDRENDMTGTIKRLVADRGFGFLADEDGREYFFHRTAVEGLRFENLAEDDHVTFDVEEGARPRDRGRK